MIKLGSTDITNVMLGTTKVDAIFLGNTKVYPNLLYHKFLDLLL